MSVNVLIVDDSKTTRTIIAKALRHANVALGEVLYARDGLEALETLKDNWVDIVFADLNMPRLSGVEMVERMADSDLLSSVPVVIVSSEGRQDRIDALLAQGAAAYLRKPFPPESLARIAGELLGSHDSASRTEPDLDEAFFTALEGFAMLVAEPLEIPPLCPKRAQLTTMRAVGPAVEVEIAVATSVEGAATVTECALGEAGGSPDDAMKELVNLVAGRLVDALAGGPFAFELPESAEIAGDEAWLHMCAMQRCRSFDAEGLPFGVALNINDRW